MRGVAFAEDQPVAPVTCGAPRLDQGPQTGQPGAVAHQDHRASVVRRMEIAVGAHAQFNAVAFLGNMGQPAAAQPQAAVRAAHLAHQQLDGAIFRQGCDGVFARGASPAGGVSVSR
ncbi:hypothetical protein G6F57_022431 [Rhizopus arrhizus]|nr:hypothetical protein G6F57_022431 [Rhizopus arrhizus]